VLFEVEDAEGAEAIIFRDEQDYVPWSEYAVPEWGGPVPQPRYSPWQFLYLNILDDARQHDAEEVSARRPIASMLISVFRVT
jgi:hypothetical protein